MTGLSPVRCEELLRTYPQFEELLTRLFEQTQYRTTATVIQTVQKQVRTWLGERDPTRTLFVGLPVQPGSEQWLYDLVRSELPPHQVITGPFTIHQPSELLMLDDCVLSGCNICGNGEDLVADEGGPFDLVLTVITAYATSAGQECVRQVLGERLTRLNFYQEEYLTLFEPGQISPSLQGEFLRTFAPDTECWAYPFHLEYKIANQWGSFPTIYEPCREVPAVRPYVSHK